MTYISAEVEWCIIVFSNNNRGLLDASFQVLKTVFRKCLPSSAHTWSENTDGWFDEVGETSMELWFSICNAIGACINSPQNGTCLTKSILHECL